MTGARELRAQGTGCVLGTMGFDGLGHASQTPCQKRSAVWLVPEQCLCLRDRHV